MLAIVGKHGPWGRQMGYMTSQYRKVEPARIDQRGMVRQPVELHRRVRCRRSEKRVEGCLADISIYGCRVNLDTGEADDAVRIKVGERVFTSSERNDG